MTSFVIDTANKREQFFKKTKTKKLTIRGFELPDDTFLPDLKILEIYNSNYDEFPKWIFNSPKLESLTFINKKKYKLPQKIGELTHLHILILNRLSNKSLPISILNLTNLKRIEIGNSDLISIDRLTQLKKLYSVIIFNTPIAKIPKELFELEHFEIE